MREKTVVRASRQNHSHRLELLGRRQSNRYGQCRPAEDVSQVNKTKIFHFSSPWRSPTRMLISFVHLSRNLYFRTVYLLMQGVSPVFVLEGTAPTLKHTEIARRNDLRRPDDQERTRKKGGRSRFNTILKECETMLNLMGLICVKGHGEAEAMCAYLNEDGVSFFISLDA